MKKLAFLFLFLSLMVFQGCDDNYSVGQDFSVSYVDVRSERNVYYLNQGIFNNFSINSVAFNSDYLFIKGYLKDNNVVDTSHYIYYIINKTVYKADPSQMDSKGLIGPIHRSEFEKKKRELKNLETLPL